MTGRASKDANDAARPRRDYRVCLKCGAPYRSYHKRRKYCSVKCRPVTDITRLRQMARKAAELRSQKPKLPHLRTNTCSKCGITFKTPERKKYCSDKCRKDKDPFTPEPNHTCRHCGNAFHAYVSKRRPRQFCSYSCHLASGGARKAGDAAVRAKQKYGAKKDANHRVIVKTFESLGARVIDLSSLGCGVPDLCVWCKDAWRLIEVKNVQTAYGRKGLNKRQKDWAETWKGGPVYIVRSVDDAIALARGNFSEVESHG